MRPSLIAAALVALTGLAGCGESPPAPSRTIAVTGQGAVSAPPDVARINLGVVTEAETAAQAMALNAERMSGVFQAIEGLGIDEADVQTASISISPVWRQVPAEGGGRRQEIDGYTATNNLRVTLRRIDDVGAVLDALTAAGANRMNGLGFEVSDADLRRDEARKAAIADARRKAELYAEAADADLGEVISVSEGVTLGPTPVSVRMEMVSQTVAAPGRNEIGVDVTVVWALD